MSARSDLFVVVDRGADVESELIGALASEASCELSLRNEASPQQLGAKATDRQLVLVGRAEQQVGDLIRAKAATVSRVSRESVNGPEGRHDATTGDFTMLEQVEAILGRQSSDKRRDLVVANAIGGIPKLAAEAWRALDGGQHPLERAPLSKNEKNENLVNGDKKRAWHDWPKDQRYAQLAEQVWARRDAELRKHAGSLDRKAGGRGASLASRRDVNAAVEKKEVRIVALSTGRGTPDDAREALDDPELLLVLAPLAYAHALEDAVYAQRSEKHASPLTIRLEILSFLVEGEMPQGPPPWPQLRLQRIDFSGRANRRELAEMLLGDDGRRSLGAERLEVRSTVSSAAVRFSVAVSGPASADRGDAIALTKLAARLIEELTVQVRPLRAWRTSFLAPLRMPDPRAYEDLRKAIDAQVEKAGTAKGDAYPRRLRLDASERHYLLPDVAGLLGPHTKNGPNRDHQIDSIELSHKGLSLEIVRADRPAPFEVPIDALRLHLFAEETMLLEWRNGEELSSSDDRRLRDYPWQRWFEAGIESGRTLAQVLDINHAARWLYSGFAATAEEGSARRTLLRLHSGNKVIGKELLVGKERHEPSIRDWFQALLEHALENAIGKPEKTEDKSPNDQAAMSDPEKDGKPEKTEHKSPYLSKIRLLGDERARLVTSVVPIGGQPRGAHGLAELDATLCRLRAVEPCGRGFPYDEEAARAELEGGRYRRFAEWGSHYVASDHSFGFLGFGDYALDPIHSQHMKTIYRDLVLLVQLRVALLRCFRDRLAEILKGWPTTNGYHLPPDFAALEQRLVLLANHFQVDRVTSQIQGTELFDLLCRQSRIKDEHALLDAELQRTSGYHEDSIERQSERRVRLLTFIGLPAAVFAALMAARDTARNLPWWNQLPDGVQRVPYWSVAGLFTAVSMVALYLWLSSLPLTQRFEEILRGMIALVAGMVLGCFGFYGLVLGIFASAALFFCGLLDRRPDRDLRGLVSWAGRMLAQLDPSRLVPNALSSGILADARRQFDASLATLGDGLRKSGSAVGQRVGPVLDRVRRPLRARSAAVGTLWRAFRVLPADEHARTRLGLGAVLLFLGALAAASFDVPLVELRYSMSALIGTGA